MRNCGSTNAPIALDLDRDVAMITAEQLNDSRRLEEAAHLSALQALVEAAEDIEAGHVYTWDEFKPRLAKLRAKAEQIAGY